MTCMESFIAREERSNRAREGVVLRFGNAAQVHEAYAIARCRNDRLLEAAKLSREALWNAERPPGDGDFGAAPSAHAAIVRHNLARLVRTFANDVRESFRAGFERVGVGVKRFKHGRRGSSDGSLERGEQEFIGAHRPREGVASHALNPLFLSKDEPRLWASHEFIAAREDEISALFKGLGEGRFVR